MEVDARGGVEDVRCRLPHQVAQCGHERRLLPVALAQAEPVRPGDTEQVSGHPSLFSPAVVHLAPCETSGPSGATVGGVCHMQHVAGPSVEEQGAGTRDLVVGVGCHHQHPLWQL